MKKINLALWCASFAALAAFESVAASRNTRPVISNADRAAASWAVQNAVSRHQYLHAMERNMEDLRINWVSPAGPYASTAAFCLVQGCQVGMDLLIRAYGEGAGTRGTKAALQRMAAINPRIKDQPEFEGAGNLFPQHTNTTPVIEIADDGKTAKGVWYTPSLNMRPNIQDGKVHLTGEIAWQKLGVDLVNEDGRWKIWHMLIAEDFDLALTQDDLAPAMTGLGELATRLPPRPNSPPANAAAPAAAAPAGGMAFEAPVYRYPQYTPERSNKVWPQLPEPYYSFAETFSYCNCVQELPALLSGKAK